jgi:hypothetical protein
MERAVHLLRTLDERRAAGIVAAVAVGLVIAVGTWLVLDRGDDARTEATVAPAPTATALQPALVSADELRRLAQVAGAPVFWAGTRPDTSLEVSRGTDGSFFVRYLPPGREAGDGRPALTVATYPRADGFGEVQGAAARDDATSFELPAGGLAVVDDAASTNVHFAYPEQPYQVEVYSPSEGVARQLVEAGAVAELR